MDSEITPTTPVTSENIPVSPTPVSSRKPKAIGILIIFILLVLVFIQYFQFRNSTDSSCGGDWSYNVKCSVGSYCKSSNQGPFVGGVCTQYLSEVFSFLHLERNPKDIKQTEIKPSPIIQNQTPTPSLKIDEVFTNNSYTNYTYGFSFKHPGLIQCCAIGGPMGDSVGIITMAVESTRMSGGAPFDGLAVYVVPNENMMSFSAYIENQKYTLVERYVEVSGGQKPYNSQALSQTIAGQPAYVLKNYDPWAGNIEFYYILYPDKQRILEISKINASKGSFDNAFSQILSSLKFLEQTQAGQMINWKTYSATGVYEIRYPENLYSVRSGTASLKAEWPGIIIIYPKDSFNNKPPLSVTYKISIVISDNSANLSMDQPSKLFGNGILIQYPSLYADTNKVKETTLDGLKAYRLDNLPVGPAGITTDIMTIKNNKIYEILVEPVQGTGDSEVNKQIIEQIISTFKLLSQSANQSTPTPIPTSINPELSIRWKLSGCRREMC